MTLLDRRTLFKAGAAGSGGLLLGPGAGLLSPAQAEPKVGRTLAGNLRIPWGVAFLPSGDALVSERGSALVFRVRRTGGRKRVGRVNNVRARGEGGLLGLAVSPTFSQDRWVYAYISTASDNRVVRMRYVEGELRDQQPVLAGIPTGSNHNGGRLAFAPGGLLYVSTGDAGDSSRSQRLSSKGGKILRMTPEGDVPADNPFGNYAWSLGHRNVQGLAFDRSGQLWATEFGQDTRDELNRIVRAGNYGWPAVEGGDGPGGFRDPFVIWEPTSSCSPSGVAITKGHAYVGALAGRALMRVDLFGDDKRTKRRFLHDRFGRIRTVALAPDGSLWITTSNRDGRGDPREGEDRVVRIRV